MVTTSDGVPGKLPQRVGEGVKLPKPPMKDQVLTPRKKKRGKRKEG